MGENRMKNVRQLIDEECEQLKILLKSKNNAYGDSFFKTLEKYGSSAVCIRMEDKINRIASLTKKSEKLTSRVQVLSDDERLGDTLLDLAGYAILTKIYLDS
jgi:hypothetical protein